MRTFAVDSKDVKIASLEKDRQTLMSELGRMRDQYTTFNSQLDSMKKELVHRLVGECFITPAFSSYKVMFLVLSYIFRTAHSRANTGVV